MKQRMGDKKIREVEAKTGRKIRSMWHRGGRHPRYWEVFFEDHAVGYWVPEQIEKLHGVKYRIPERLEMTTETWREKL